MNQVILTLKVTRANSEQCQLEFFREGQGDDLVDSRADEFELLIKDLCDRMIKRDGGEYTKG